LRVDLQEAKVWEFRKRKSGLQREPWSVFDEAWCEEWGHNGKNASRGGEALAISAVRRNSHAFSWTSKRIMGQQAALQASELDGQWPEEETVE
jgi:hypothetical protein